MIVQLNENVKCNAKRKIKNICIYLLLFFFAFAIMIRYQRCGALAQLVEQAFSCLSPPVVSGGKQFLSDLHKFDKEIWGISTVGSARHSHCRGQEFESPMLHQKFLIRAFSKEEVRICFMIEISLAESIVTFFRCIKRHESICIRCFRALFMVGFPRNAYFLSLWLPFFEATKRS